MQISMNLGIGRHSRAPTAFGYDVFSALETHQGFAIDFTKGRMRVRDDANPANNYDGPPQNKLTVYGTAPWEVHSAKGLNLSAARDFGVALATSAFPYDPTAVHVYAKFRLNAGDSADQRYLFMVDNVGNDRFAMYTTSGAGFRWVTADGVSADTEVSTQVLESDTEYRMLFGADANGRSWVDDAGVQTDDQLHLLQAATPSHVGIGGYPDQVLRGLDGYLAEILVVCGDVIASRRLTSDPFGPYYAAEGDSHTFNVSFGMPETEFYPALLGTTLGVTSRNFGSSGDSSAQMLADVADLFVEDTPSVASFYAGSNDEVTTVLASPTPTVGGFDVLDASKVAVGGWVLVNGESRKVASIAGSAITLEQDLSAPPAAGAEMSIDTFANIVEWIDVMKSAGVSKVLVVGSHYLNFPTGGDTVAAEQTLRAATRLAQKAAAAARNVPYIDTYAFMRDKIVSGEVAQGDWAVWHQGDSNTHLTAAGEQALADAIAPYIN